MMEIKDTLANEVQTLCQNRAMIMKHEDTAWSSITFKGTRHEIELGFNGKEDVTIGEAFSQMELDEIIKIPGQLIADASLREMDFRFNEEDGESLRLVVVFLLLDED